jgi:hypothetical protein
LRKPIAPGRGSNHDQSITRGYTYEEWQSLSAAKQNRVYWERERLETARTIAAIIRGQNEATNNDDISTITIPINNPGNGNNTPTTNQQCSTAMCSLDNIRQATSRRRIGAYHMVSHKLNDRRDIVSIHNKQSYPIHCRTKLDSHADTCGGNDTVFILEYTGKVAEVAGFSKALQTMQDIPIVKATLAYDDPHTGETMVLIVNQALYFGDQLSHILLNQNQMRTHGLIVEDCPRNLSGGRSTHSIHTENNELNILLQLHGIILYFNVRRPTKKEIETC